MAANLYIRYQMLFQKILSKSDIDEGRVYIPAGHAEIFRHLANRAEVTAYDVRMGHSWPMRFYRRDDQRAYLGHSWRDFAIANRLREGDKVTFYELRPQEEQGHGARLIFQIEVPRFDLNEPPSPEN